MIGRPDPTLLERFGNLVGFFTWWVERAPERVALIDPHGAREERVTFRELDERANQVAGALSDLGVCAGDRVLLMVPMSIALYETMVAVMKLGASIVFVDPSAPPRALDAMVTMAEPRAFVGIAKAHLLRAVSPAVRAIPKKLVVGPGFIPATRNLRALASTRTATFETTRVSLESPALITFTSGTTGQPKGVVRSHAFLNAQGAALSHHLPRREDDVDMPSMPAFVLQNLSEGVTTVLPFIPSGRVDDVDPARVLSLIDRFRVTTFGGSPAFLRPVVARAREQGGLERVRFIGVGGARVGHALLEELVAVTTGEVKVIYGSTECEPIAHVDAREVLDAGHMELGALVGSPVPEVELRVVPAAEVDLIVRDVAAAAAWSPVTSSPWTVGELLVSGGHVQERFMGDASAVRLTKIRDREGRLWHRTFDLAALDEGGRVWLAGRVSDGVMGQTGPLYTHRVEAVVEAVRGVGRAALVAQDGEPTIVVEALADDAGVIRRVRERCEEAGFGAVGVRIVDCIPVDARHRSRIDRARLIERLRRAA